MVIAASCIHCQGYALPASSGDIANADCVKVCQLKVSRMADKGRQCGAFDIHQLDSALQLPNLGKNAQEQMAALVQSHAVVVFGHSWCPYSLEAVRVCNNLGIKSFAFCRCSTVIEC